MNNNRVRMEDIKSLVSKFLEEAEAPVYWLSYDRKHVLFKKLQEAGEACGDESQKAEDIYVDELQKAEDIYVDEPQRTEDVNEDCLPRSGNVQVDELLEKFKRDDLLELHVYDDHHELRAVKTGDDDWFICSIISESDCKKYKEQNISISKGSYDDEKVETLCVEKAYQDVAKYIRVVNYIKYDENGMISVVNYRIAPYKEGGN